MFDAFLLDRQNVCRYTILFRRRNSYWLETDNSKSLPLFTYRRYQGWHKSRL